VRASLHADLVGEPEPLIRPEDLAAGGPTAAEEVLFETGGIRALRPARPRAPGHVVVEPVAEVASLLDADDALVAELMAGVRHVAAELTRRHGGCRIETRVRGSGSTAGGGGEATRLRWDLFPDDA